MSYDFSDLLGKTLRNIDVLGKERIEFTENNGTVWASHHAHVEVVQTIGDPKSTTGAPILEAAEEFEFPEASKAGRTLTRQRIKTDNGEVTFVWQSVAGSTEGETPNFEKYEKI